MKNLHSLLQRVITNGQDQFNERTGKMCRVVVGEQMVFDLADDFPAITTRKMPFKSCLGELLGFFRGYTNASDFSKLGCNWWYANANETAGWLANPYREGQDDLGLIYGAQWTAWSDKRVAMSRKERYQLESNGFSECMYDARQGWYLMERHINQLENALHKLLTDPSDRRIIVSGWNVAELDMMALPPCHMDYRFVALDGASPNDAKTLHVVMTIRSWDLYLGAPANIAVTSTFLEIMARLAGMKAGTVTIQATNAHLYHDHFDQTHELLKRSEFESPKLVLSDRIQAVSADDIAGAFSRIEPEDIWMEGYQSHGALPAPMAA